MKVKYRVDVLKDGGVRFWIGNQGFNLERHYEGELVLDEEHSKWMAEMLQKALDRLAEKQKGKACLTEAEKKYVVSALVSGRSKAEIQYGTTQQFRDRQIEKFNNAIAVMEGAMTA